MFELMDTTERLARLYNTTPFEVLEHDAEHVIMVINYRLELAERAPEKTKTERKETRKKKDSFWDF